VDVEHLYAGEDFNPEVGFHRRIEGFRRSHGKFEFSPRPQNLRGVRKVAYSVDLDYFADAHGGRVQSRDQQALFRVDFESGDVAQVDAVRTYEAIVVPFLVAKDVRITAGSYEYTVTRGSYTFGSQRKVSGSASARRAVFMAAACTRSAGAAGSSFRRRSTLSRRSRGTRSMGHGARAPTTLSATG
jgi:hypothetical protein